MNHEVLPMLRNNFKPEGKKVTQERLAEILNCDRKTIVNYEKGSATPTNETVNKILDFYGVTEKEQRKNIIFAIYGRESDTESLTDILEEIPKKHKNTQLTDMLTKEIPKINAEHVKKAVTRIIKDAEVINKIFKEETENVGEILNNVYSCCNKKDYTEVIKSIGFIDNIVDLLRLLDERYIFHFISTAHLIPSPKVGYYMILKEVEKEKTNSEFLKRNEDYNIFSLQAIINEYEEYIIASKDTVFNEKNLLMLNRRMQSASDNHELTYWREEFLEKCFISCISQTPDIECTDYSLGLAANCMDGMIDLLINGIKEPQEFGEYHLFRREDWKQKNAFGNTIYVYGTGENKLVNYIAYERYMFGNNIKLLNTFFEIRDKEDEESKEEYEEFFKKYDGDYKNFDKHCPGRLYLLYCATTKAGYDLVNFYLDYIDPCMYVNEDFYKTRKEIEETFKNTMLLYHNQIITEIDETGKEKHNNMHVFFWKKYFPEELERYLEYEDQKTSSKEEYIDDDLEFNEEDFFCDEEENTEENKVLSFIKRGFRTKG